MHQCKLKITNLLYTPEYNTNRLIKVKSLFSSTWYLLSVRKTTSGKVHINHVPQLKERNGAEMGGGSVGGGEGGGERIMSDCVWGIQSCSVALFALTWCWKHLWISKVMTIGPDPLGRENQRLIYLHLFHGDNFSSGMLALSLFLYNVKGGVVGCSVVTATRCELLLLLLLILLIG